MAAVGVASKAVLDALPAGPLKVGVTVVLLYAIVSLFAGTLMGFSGLRPKPGVGYGPDFALQIRHDNKLSAERIADALKDFEIKNIVRANEASAANMAIRNGVIAFALAMTFSLFLPPKHEAPIMPNIQINVDMRTTTSLPRPSAPTPHSIEASSCFCSEETSTDGRVILRARLVKYARSMHPTFRLKLVFIGKPP